MLQNMTLKVLLLTTAMFLLVNIISVYALNYTSNFTNSTLAGTPIMHILYWQDSIGLSGYIFSFDNCTNSLINDSWTNMTGTGNWSNATKTINSTIGCNVKWCVYANDSSNNWNGTSCDNPFTYHAKGIPTFSTSVSTPITYGGASDYEGYTNNEVDGGCNYTLLRNGVEIDTGSSVSDHSALEAGNYNYTYFTEGCENYTFGSDEKDLTVGKATRDCFLETDKAWTRFYDGTESSTTCSVSAGTSDGTMAFTVNSEPISNPDYKSAMGTYDYACQWTGGINYEDCEEQINTLEIVNSNPSIYFIESIPNQDPTESTTTTVTFKVSINDPNSYSDISSVSTEFNMAGEETKIGDCVEGNVINSTARNYSCSVDMEYYDASGEWSVMVYAEDTSFQNDTEWSSFTYSLLTAWVMNVNSLNFGSIYHGENNIGATENPMILENIGNDDLSGKIKVTALDLRGVTNSSEYIPAGNFSVNIADAQGGDALINNTAKTVSGTSLDRGLDSEEELYFYILDVPLDLSFQVYNTAGLGEWTIST